MKEIFTNILRICNSKTTEKLVALLAFADAQPLSVKERLKSVSLHWEWVDSVACPVIKVEFK